MIWSKMKRNFYRNQTIQTSLCTNFDIAKYARGLYSDRRTIEKNDTKKRERIREETIARQGLNVGGQEEEKERKRVRIKK